MSGYIAVGVLSRWIIGIYTLVKKEVMVGA